MSKQMKDTTKTDNIYHHSSYYNSFNNQLYNNQYSLSPLTIGSLKSENNQKYNSILNLQKTAGNQVVQHLISLGRLHPKLKVSHPSDPYEQEADRVAGQVVKNDFFASAPLKSESDDGTGLKINRKSCACEMTQKKQNEEDKDIQVSRKSADTISNIQFSANNLSFINSSIGESGKPLDKQTQGYMEPRFRYDFSNVRIHANSESASRSAESLNALAYTIGNDIVFSSGTYMPSTTRGRQLLAHELVHVVQQQKLDKSVLLLQRQPSDPNAGLQEEAKKSVKDTIDSYLQIGSKIAVREVDLGGTKLTVKIDLDRDYLERTINYLYSSVVQAEDIIDTQLNGDSGLKRQMRTAYISVLSTLMHRAATELNMNENDLYRENIGRIPVWAWKKPHYYFPGITPPIPMGVNVNPRTKEANFTLGGFNVVIKPDVFNVNLKPHVGAETNGTIRWSGIEYEHTDDQIGTVTSIRKIRRPTLEIQVSYAPGRNPKNPGGYGRGTTPQDVAGGKITPSSISLGFHEGSHALDYMEFVRNHLPPRFIGKVGDTKIQFDAAILRWNNDWKTYMKEYNENTNKRTHCVGFTRDQWYDKYHPEVVIVRECP